MDSGPVLRVVNTTELNSVLKTVRKGPLGISKPTGRPEIITAFRRRRFSQKSAGNRRIWQKPVCPIEFVPCNSSLISYPLGAIWEDMKLGSLHEIAVQHEYFLRKGLDTFKFFGHVMRAILSVRPKCSHRCVSLKETLLKPCANPQAHNQKLSRANRYENEMV